jgi:hypothetical protein
MQSLNGHLVLSPTDLNDYVECPHLTTLELEVARGQRAIVMPTLTFAPSKRPLRIHRRGRPVRVGRPLPQRTWR